MNALSHKVVFYIGYYLPTAVSKNFNHIILNTSRNSWNFYTPSRTRVCHIGIKNNKGRYLPWRELTQRLTDGGYTFPVFFDLNLDAAIAYGISAFPTTYLINANGDAVAYVPGAMNAQQLEHVIDMIR